MATKKPTIHDGEYNRIQTVAELRYVLLEEIQNVRSGKTALPYAKTVANLAGKVIVTLLVDQQRIIGEKPETLMLEHKSK